MSENEFFPFLLNLADLQQHNCKAEQHCLGENMPQEDCCLCVVEDFLKFRSNDRSSNMPECVVRRTQIPPATRLVHPGLWRSTQEVVRVLPLSHRTCLLPPVRKPT